MQRWLVDAGAQAERVRRVPCCVTRVAYSADARARVRRELGVEHKLVLAYVGTITRYQHVEDGLLPFFAAAFASTADVHLLALTSDEVRMAALLSALPVPRSSWTVRRVPQSRVPEYLCAADAGVLLREATRMNRVSMPVKFGEYLSCGVPVIASRVGGWIDELVDGSGAGLVIDWFGADERRRTLEAERVCGSLRKDGERMRRAALALCERDFLWSRYVDDVRAAYTESLEPNPPLSRDH